MAKIGTAVRAFAALAWLSALTLVPANIALASSSNGSGSDSPAFYDGRLLTINLVEVPKSDPLIANNPNTNTIYATDDLDEPQELTPVIDAVPGDGFNPLWRQVLISFNAGVAPHQFLSDDEVKAAASGNHPEITLTVTDEIYRCSVVGKK